MLREVAKVARVPIGQTGVAWLYSHCRRSMATRVDTMRAGDRVLLQVKRHRVRLSKQLDPEETTISGAGELKHSEIIGKKSRDTVKSSQGHDVRAYLPTLAEYVTLTPRRVTPIYPSDANLIVSLLDIDADIRHYNSSEISPSLEILEAGTGHASLTLHLARAIHGANQSAKDSGGHSLQFPSALGAVASVERTNVQLRHAVIHTIDVSRSCSQHAQQIVSGFRQSMYSNDIEFHVGDVSEWIAQQYTSRGLDGKEDKEDEKAFLSHIILDLPRAHDHLATAASALHVNGGLLVFNPSISQIMTVVKKVREDSLPLQLERVVEVGQGMTGGKEWDVRCVKPRALIQAEADAARNAQAAAATIALNKAKSSGVVEEAAATGDDDDGDESNESEIRDEGGEDSEETPAATTTTTTNIEQDKEGWEMVCRPKAGVQVAGGGFVAFFKKMHRKRRSELK